MLLDFGLPSNILFGRFARVNVDSMIGSCLTTRRKPHGDYYTVQAV